jgi:thioesterase domain-containing protein
VPLWRSGRATPLFLVHGRNGQAFVSPQFLQLLGNDQPVWAFQARGLDGSSEPHATVEAMAAEYLEAMRRERSHGPYFLGSLCAGAYIVAVMARTLAQAGEKVLPLLLLDPPNTLRDPGYAQLSDGQFTSKMLARSAARGRARLDDPGSMRALLRTARAFDAAIAHHTPLPYDGAAYVLSSDRRMHGAEALDLRRIFTGRYKRYEVGANHANALDARNPVFARALRRCVELIQQAGNDAAAPVFTYRAQGAARGD